MSERVEPVSRVLTGNGWQIAPGTYYAAVKRPPSARAVRDAEIVAEIRRMRPEYEEAHGLRKTWLELNRCGIGVARCTVERVMARDGMRDGGGGSRRSDNVHLRRWSGAYLDDLGCSMSDSGSRRLVSLWRQLRIPGVSRGAADMMLASPVLPGQSSSRKDRELS